MERQRSFFFKPTRLLVFLFTLPSSILFLTFFTVWLFKSTPLIIQETSLEFNKSSFNASVRTTFPALTGNSSANSFQDSILMDTQLRAPKNASGFTSISVVRKENESETLRDGRDEEGEKSKFAALQEKLDVLETPSQKIEATRDGKLKEKETTRAISKESIQEAARRDEKVAERARTTSQGKIEALRSEVTVGEKKSRAIKAGSKRACDVTKGRWVYDESYPFYTNSSCPFIDEGFDCAGNGRLDKDYMKWRWQPQDCEIPRFNATKMLGLMRGKRLVFVGDSINRNQWESLLCMLMGAVKDPKKVYETHGRRITKEKGNYSFKFVDYSCTIEYYVSHYLVHESKARVGQKRVQTLRIDAIDHGSSRWRGADILIFNTAHWWSHHKTKAGINYYQEGSQVYPRLDVSVAFRRALMTWSSWVDKHINSRKTQVFFQSYSPSHFSGGQWNSGGHCKEATRPLNETLSTLDPEKNTITKEIIKQMKTPVTFLNITTLSGLRIDGHPSMFGKKPGNPKASSIQDCSHWCLPGVPDTWSELLYYQLGSK